VRSQESRTTDKVDVKRSQYRQQTRSACLGRISYLNAGARKER